MDANQPAPAGAEEAAEPAPGGRIRIWHLLVLLALLASPGLALWRVWPVVNAPLLVILWVLISVTTYGLYALDKQRARAGEWRVPELMLHFAELIGGWPGAFLAQRRLRHKTRKPAYQLVFWLIVLAHVAVLADFQLDWRVTRAAWRQLRPVPAETRQP